MKVVLIPCSGRKSNGGSNVPVSLVQAAIGEGSWAALAHARSTLSDLLGLEPGPDLGNSPSTVIQLRPAWQRYTGNLYSKALLTEEDVRRPDVRIFVVSALFGVISACDTIRHYDVAMTDRLPNGPKVNHFWRGLKLSLIVADLIGKIGAREVHDFLSGSYREAVKGLEQRLPAGCGYFPRAYPGLGTGSDYHRGMDVRELLSQ